MFGWAVLGRYPGETTVGRINAVRIHGFVMGLFVYAFLAAGANAAVVVSDIGNLNAGTTGTFSRNVPTSGAAQFAAPLPDGGELIAFSTNSPTNISAASTSVNLLDVFGISGFGFSLVQATGPGNTFSTFTEITSGGLTGGVLTLSYSGLASGVYGFLFTGVITGSAGGFYAGNYTVSAVPLPPAVWLFLSALIGLAGVARKKSKRTVAVKTRPAEAPLGA